MPLLVSSAPTVGPTTSLPATLNSPMPLFCSAAMTASLVLLSDCPFSPPIDGTRTRTWCRDGSVRLDDDVLAAAREVAIERLADVFHAGRPRELGHHDRAARKLDAFRDALRHENEDARDDDEPGDDQRMPAPAEKVEVRVVENMHG